MNTSLQNFTEKMPKKSEDYFAKRTSRSSSFVFATVTLLSGLFTASVAQAAAQPNIVFILADDLDATTSEYWERATNVGKDDPLKKTRALLRDRGMTFTEAFAPVPICCPARATILTGKYGHNTGVLTNTGAQGGFDAFRGNGNEEKTMAVWLKNAGYRTGLIGKYLNGLGNYPTHIPPGWSEWNALATPYKETAVAGDYRGYNYKMAENIDVDGSPKPLVARLVPYGKAESDYSTDVIARKAVDFINRAESNDTQPFFLYVAPTAPHAPLPPAPRNFGNPYTNSALPKRPNYNEADMSDKPAWLFSTQIQRKAEGAVWHPIDYRLRQGSLYALDDLVESIVNTLAAKGELENTYLIFMSDNGYNLGSHALIHKMAPYEESIRVPLVIRGPGIVANETRAQMVLETDIAPTVAQWAGIKVPADVDGRSLLPLLQTNPPLTWRSDFLIQYLSDPSLGGGIKVELPPELLYLGGYDIPTYTALRNGRYKYIEWSRPFTPNTNDIAHELYDLQKDPYELENLVTPTKPIRRLLNWNLAKSMKARMDQLKTCKGASCQ